MQKSYITLLLKANVRKRRRFAATNNEDDDLLLWFVPCVVVQFRIQKKVTIDGVSNVKKCRKRFNC